jgi:hypothetical protein
VAFRHPEGAASGGPPPWTLTRGIPVWRCGGGGADDGGLFNAAGEKIPEVAPRSRNMGIWWDGDLLRELLDGVRLDDPNPAPALHSDARSDLPALSVAWQNVAYNQPAHPGFYLEHGMKAPPKPAK